MKHLRSFEEVRILRSMSVPNTFSCDGKVIRPVLSSKLGSLGIFANSLRSPVAPTAQNTQQNFDGLSQTGGSEPLYLMRENEE